MSDAPGDRDVLRALAGLASDAGPVLRLRGDREFLTAIAETARLAFDAAACSIAVLSENERELEFRAAAGAGADATVGLRIPSDRGIAGWAVMSGQAIAIADVSRDPRFAAEVAATTGYVPTAIMAMPLENERRTFGVIEVLDRRRGGGEGMDDLELLACFARLTTLALETARVFSNLGRVLFESAALAADGDDLRHALERLAADAPKPRAELTQLTLLLHELAEAGPDELLAATRVANAVLIYARTRRR